MKNKRLKVSGFTLIEVLVSLVIMGIMLTLATSSYWVFMQTNIKAGISRDLQQEMRFGLTRMTDQMRGFSIDYSAYGDVTSDCGSGNLNQKFCFGKNSKGEFVFLEYKEDPDEDADTDDEMLFFDGQPLFSSKFRVSGFYVAFSPTESPYRNGASEFQIQPKATFFLKVESKRFENIKLELQTTISSRKYND